MNRIPSRERKKEKRKKKKKKDVPACPYQGR